MKEEIKNKCEALKAFIMTLDEHSRTKGYLDFYKV